MSTQKNYILVVNPISGDIDKAEIIGEAKEYAAKQDIHLVVYETTGKNDESEIQKLQEKNKAERIIIAGGDGTIKMVAEAVENHDVILGILPAGSANGLSVDLNLPDSLEENLEIAFNNNYMEMDMISINGKKSLHLSDIGINAELIKNYENSSIRGKLGYALQAFNTLAGLKPPFHAVIETHLGRIETEARMVVVANSQKYGTGVAINPNGVMNDGKFEIVILKNLDLIVFSKILSGNMPVENDDVEIISTDKAVVTTNSPVSFQIDGEYCDEVTRLEVEILPNQMRVAVP
ncbi:MULTISPECIES: diacylglycerol/lipid kinase family protein [Flavobacterium]|jgi:diacylglycerol kinase (ATP)|uniref:YegS/Rv2252/BmrU family lipid kinase n=1 Tax=Flavobacterium lindanitolerans TaxID=428988 RepID=A0A497V396_9FLAO|nr:MULTISPECIES: YegS/Rv2252/BmrU family lipid kinase [Flavobacterium]PZQ92415.1 MAG: diacylglycerol kinase [Flavobacterium johnsoniae]MDQ7959691.1 YegS/Rv2252/BmrU family lipid kinase [Flavobacterium lindanitolerans]OJX52112.1 MAG: diacylglycerol kinase [Flavobacterium sp. 38-13]PKW29494.1 YegS/Rv2252/BmrU family lipid kinase [Flavobacterium lindanitolerans]RLJ35005.1 YegS/Rv2252/BmrU family lipid kinase [Flavobacterium lindanitolerans]